MGDQHSPAPVTTVETALGGRAAQPLHGIAKPKIRRVRPGTALVRHGEPGTEIYLILDG